MVKDDRCSVLYTQLISFISYCRETKNPFNFCKSKYFCHPDFPYNERMFMNEISDKLPEDFLEEILS